MEKKTKPKKQQTYSFEKVNPDFLCLYRMENAAGHIFPVVFFSLVVLVQCHTREKDSRRPRMSPVQCCQDEFHFPKYSKVKACQLGV